MTLFADPSARTSHARLAAWVDEVVALTKPDAVRWCDGSPDEWNELVEILVAAGTAQRLNDDLLPHSIYARTDPGDVARVEDRTFICSRSADDAGPTNNWVDPVAMKATLTTLFDGCMRGRTLYVMPFCMGHLDAADPKFGVEISDSPYVALSMGIMTRMGADVLAALEATDAPFVPCLHSVGMPLEPGQQDVPWPCNSEKYIVHFPEERSIWSYGSGYGGNSLLGKKAFALRIASVMARDEGWLAEHMLILKITSPEGRSYHLTAAFPSACGKTNLAMIAPTIDGWRVETLGDDIAWMHVGEDGRLYAVNPETGIFGVAPGTGWSTNPHAMRTIEAGHSVFTNVALTDEGGVWWEGYTDEPPGHLTDWRGRSWTPENGPAGGSGWEKAAHPNSRFCTPIVQCPILADEFADPRGVPIDAILFGGRRATTVPLVTQSDDWLSGVLMGATCSSETTAAAAGAVGVVRRDPMAMLPFIGYHAGDYLQHWVDLAEHLDENALPKIFYVNWFRKSPDGTFLWPGFGENSRVLKWIVQRLEGTVAGQPSPIGLLPADGELDVEGLAVDPADVAAATAYNPEEWAEELPRIDEWFELFGAKLPAELRAAKDAWAEGLTRPSLRASG